MSLHKKQLANGLRRRTRISADSSRWKLLNAEKSIVFGVWSTDCNPACRANVKIPAIRSISPLAKTLCRQRLTRGGRHGDWTKRKASAAATQFVRSARATRRQFASAISPAIVFPFDALRPTHSALRPLSLAHAIVASVAIGEIGEILRTVVTALADIRYWPHLVYGSCLTPNGWRDGSHSGARSTTQAGNRP